MKVAALTAEQLGPATDLLAVSLLDDSGVRAMLGRWAGDIEVTRRWFTSLLTLVRRSGGDLLGAEVDGKLSGVMVVTPPDHHQPPGAVLAWMFEVSMLCGPAGVWRVIGHDRARRRAMAGQPAVVEFVAVAEDGRGRGLARAMFAHAAAKFAGHGLWLDTTKPDNVPIFAALGFERLGGFVDRGIHFTAMVLPPRREHREQQR